MIHCSIFFVFAVSFLFFSFFGWLVGRSVDVIAKVVAILKELPQWVRMVCARRPTLPPLPSRPIDPTQNRAAFAARVS